MSAILSADDLNDFISPGVACIKPVETPSEAAEDAGEVEIQIDENGVPLEISKIDGKVSTLSAAQISLADCLACSGCITSAEEVLVAQHSHDQLLKALRDGTKSFVVSISHQSRSSLAHAFGYSVEQMDRILINFFQNQLGFKYVVGTALGRKLSLLQESHQMIQRQKSTTSSPVLSSICPGWVLYAEKTHPYVLPYMSNVKSAQQITGCILKTLAAKELNIAREDVYHLSIMPCFDKKLESARPESSSELASSDVDCVLTAKELINLIESSEYSLIPENGLETLSTSPLDELYRSCAPKTLPFQELSWMNDSGSQSGGYAHNYLSIYKNHLLHKDPSMYREEDFRVLNIEGKNSDVYEMRLIHKDQKIASAAVVNGFRNIQNLVRRLKPTPDGVKTTKTNPLAARRRARLGGKVSTPSSQGEEAADASKCDYVEIMACPNGCINGGGQISSPQPSSEKEWLTQVKDVYEKIGMIDLASESNSNLVESLLSWSTEFSDGAGISQSRLYHTSFSEVEKPTDPNSILLGAKW
ncbi:hypothetical protein JCM33374_g2809 [Metschnikowia sp. JCM 33374]|nr:hypothetical protein JCM33374_g2809 [Metschnikowia sp. JCM 33374]